MAHQFLSENHNDFVNMAQTLGHENLNIITRYITRTYYQLCEDQIA